jgi:hypothetical protein
VTIYPSIRGPNADELSQSTLWPYLSPGTLVCLCVGGFFFLTCQSVHGFIRWILSPFHFPLFLTKLATITRVRSVVSPIISAPRPHTSLQRTCMHAASPPVSLGLWLSSALVVTYYCLISFLASVSYLFCFFGLLFLLNPG